MPIFKNVFLLLFQLVRTGQLGAYSCREELRRCAGVRQRQHPVPGGCGAMSGGYRGPRGHVRGRQEEKTPAKCQLIKHTQYHFLRKLVTI